MTSLHEQNQVTLFLARLPMDFMQGSAPVVGELVSVARVLLAAVLLSRLLHGASSEVVISLEVLALAGLPAFPVGSSLEGHSELLSNTPIAEHTH